MLVIFVKLFNLFFFILYDNCICCIILEKVEFFVFVFILIEFNVLVKDIICVLDILICFLELVSLRVILIILFFVVVRLFLS